MIKGETYIVHIGNNLDILPTLEDNSIDSIVTDPPYELGFMGKKWDSSGIAYNTELWKECLRILKPGGHLLSFGGTRTWHRVAVAIEDAGFEVRDSIAWMYGSGFPKSLDISKAIDKGGAVSKPRALKFVNWMRSTGLTAKEANAIVEKADIASHYFRLDQPAIATAELFDKLRPHLPEVPEEIERLVAERTGIEWTAYKNREVIGKREVPKGHSFASEKYGKESGVQTVDETKSHTAEAQQWEGWGTALKPAFEPIVVARKPLIGTVAANVLEYGTGGLNIDGSRIGTEGGGTQCNQRDEKGNCLGHQDANNSLGGGVMRHALNTASGRWPANVILDSYTAELLDEQSGISKSQGGAMAKSSIWESGKERTTNHFGDTGGASRFFYVAKASKRDRNEGLDDLPISRPDTRTSTGMGTFEEKGVQPQRNFHPTVKPTALMRYLVKLVTPPGGTVLDPFTGSGSTGKAAILEGFKFVGIELTEDYIPIIEGRLKHAEETANQTEEGLF